MPMITFSNLVRLHLDLGWESTHNPETRSFTMRNRYGRKFIVRDWSGGKRKKIRIEPLAERLPYADN